MPRTHRAYWSVIATLGLLIFAPGCERGIIVRGDVGLELNHAPPVCGGGCGPHGCASQGGGHGHGHGGGFPGIPGFAKGPTWPAEPYRHPRFHALPLGPIFDPRIEPAAFYDQAPTPAAQRAQEPYWEPHVAPPPTPKQEMWIDPPNDGNYELPVPDMTSTEDGGAYTGEEQGPEFQHSGYEEMPPAAAQPRVPNSDGWTRPRMHSQRSAYPPRRLQRPPHQYPSSYPPSARYR